MCLSSGHHRFQWISLEWWPLNVRNGFCDCCADYLCCIFIAHTLDVIYLQLLQIIWVGASVKEKACLPLLTISFLDYDKVINFFSLHRFSFFFKLSLQRLLDVESLLSLPLTLDLYAQMFSCYGFGSFCVHRPLKCIGTHIMRFSAEANHSHPPPYLVDLQRTQLYDFQTRCSFRFHFLSVSLCILLSVFRPF